MSLVGFNPQVNLKTQRFGHVNPLQTYSPYFGQKAFLKSSSLGDGYFSSKKKPADFFPELTKPKGLSNRQRLNQKINNVLKGGKLYPNNLKQVLPADVLVVLAHPDDELMMLGTLNNLSSKGYRVQLVYASSGCKGVDRTNRGLTGGQLADVRENEQVNALKAVGVKLPPVFLKVPDGEILENKSNIQHHLVQLLKQANPAIVMTFGDDGVTGHADHVDIGNLVKQTVALNANHSPVYQLSHSQEADRVFEAVVGRPDSWQGLTPVEDVAVDVKVAMDESIQLQKTSAMACHQTQFTPETVADFQAYFKAYPFETFIRA